MKVYFIGAGPGAVDLITLRGLRILQDARMVLYAGSLVPVDLLKYCRTDAESVDTAKLNLDEQIAYYARASAVPATEAIAQWAPHRASMCIFLSGAHLKKEVADMSLHYPLDTRVA